jgi:ACR3 family arsenite transporter
VTDAPGAAPVAPMRRFERWLSVWVLSCMTAGVVLSQLAPGLAQTLGALQIAQVNVPVGLLIWVMVVPMLLRIDFGAVGQVRQHWRGIGITLFVNWAVKPFSMALLGTLFVRHVFAPWLPADRHDSYLAGLVLLAAAPCTAMVFVWSRLVRGDAWFTLTQVAVNDVIMVFAFAPIVALLLGVASVPVPWFTLLASVGLYIVVPLGVAQAWRGRLLRAGGDGAVDRMLARVEPWSTGALLGMLVLLFLFQGEALVAQPGVVVLLAVPISLQVWFNAGLAWWLGRRAGVAPQVLGPCALIAASNFFELAVAAAVSLYGIDSGAALATVVGVLVEVPVMLSVVALIERGRRHTPAQAAA